MAVNDVVTYVGDIRLIGTIIDANKNTIGYVLYLEKKGSVEFASLALLQTFLANYKASNFEVSASGAIICTECALSRLPHYTISSNQLVPLNSKNIYVLGEVRERGKVVGYKIISGAGKVAELSVTDISNYVNQGVDLVNVHFSSTNKVLIPNKEDKFIKIERKQVSSKPAQSTAQSVKKASPQKGKATIAEDENFYGNKVSQKSKDAYIMRLERLAEIFSVPTVSDIAPRGSFNDKSINTSLSDYYKFFCRVLKKEVRAYCSTSEEQKYFDYLYKKFSSHAFWGSDALKINEMPIMLRVYFYFMIIFIIPNGTVLHVSRKPANKMVMLLIANNEISLLNIPRKSLIPNAWVRLNVALYDTVENLNIIYKCSQEIQFVKNTGIRMAKTSLFNGSTRMWHDYSLGARLNNNCVLQLTNNSPYALVKFDKGYDGDAISSALSVNHDGVKFHVRQYHFYKMFPSDLATTVDNLAKSYGDIMASYHIYKLLQDYSWFVKASTLGTTRYKDDNADRIAIAQDTFRLEIMFLEQLLKHYNPDLYSALMGYLSDSGQTMHMKVPSDVDSSVFNQVVDSFYESGLIYFRMSSSSNIIPVRHKKFTKIYNSFVKATIVDPVVYPWFAKSYKYNAITRLLRRLTLISSR